MGNRLSATDAPLVVVHGNCQAEALRALLDGAAVRTVRIPPAHELTPADLDGLTGLVRRADVLVSQPIRPDYRDLPIGTAQLATLTRPSARTVVVPIVRYAGLHPYQAIVRHAREPAAVPPVVPYHDLRTVAAAATGDAPETGVHADPDVLREVGRRSLAELARREARCDIVISDLVEPLGREAVHTINHPGNALLVRIARRIQAAAGLPEAAEDPGRALLGAIRAPVHPRVAAARGLPPDGPTRWTVSGQPVDDDRIVTAHLDWYRRHPWFVDACLARHAELFDLLGLTTSARRAAGSPAS